MEKGLKGVMVVGVGVCLCVFLCVCGGGEVPAGWPEGLTWPDLEQNSGKSEGYNCVYSDLHPITIRILPYTTRNTWC